MPPLPQNLLLQSLSPKSRDQILSHAKHVELAIRAPLQGPGIQPHHIYFITGGIASVVSNLIKGGVVETTIIGREGMSSGLSLLGSSASPTETFMQVSGSAYEMRFEALRDLFRSSEEIRTRIHQCIHQQALTVNQISACNKFHDSESRLARWLLMVSDRMQSDTFSLTQEFLGQMLGTRRPTVALIAGTLQKAGFIQYSRGKMKILSHERLETIACECYDVTRRLLSELYQ